MATGAIRAAYFYEAMDIPYTGTGFDSRNHILLLNDNGINTVMIKVASDVVNPLSLRRWKNHLAHATSRNMSVMPVFNYQNATYLKNFSTAYRRYSVTSSAISFLINPDTLVRTVACPLDAVYIRAILCNAFQRFPQTPSIIWDPEFYGSPGGFHAYSKPCHCDGCRVDWHRFTYNIDSRCPIDPADVSLPAEAGDGTGALLTFELARHQALITRFALQASWQTVGILDNIADDLFIASTVAGLVAAGKTVTVFSELTYNSGLAPAGARQLTQFAGVPVVGGFWLNKHTPAELQSRIIAMGSPGYWLFTTYSFWLTQAAVATIGDPYDLAGSGLITDYLAAIAAANA